jgi:hypothetical protein
MPKAGRIHGVLGRPASGEGRGSHPTTQQVAIARGSSSLVAMGPGFQMIPKIYGQAV